MVNREKVIKGLDLCLTWETFACDNCPYATECEEAVGNIDSSPLRRDALELLKEYEVRELTIDEWREWKANPNRNPICRLWENDTSPMWTLNPNDVHEPALLMGKLKLFTGKPTFEQCKEIEWK